MPSLLGQLHFSLNIQGCSHALLTLGFMGDKGHS